MTTAQLPCGCSITCSMYGEREVLWIAPCFAHAKDAEVQRLFTQLWERLKVLPEPVEVS